MEITTTKEIVTDNINHVQAYDHWGRPRGTNIYISIKKNEKFVPVDKVINFLELLDFNSMLNAPAKQIELMIKELKNK